MPQGISAHGTLIEVQETPGGSFTEIAELGDIQMPGLMRNEFDITSHNRDIDTYVLGVLRRDDVTFPMFFNKVIASQVILRTLLIANTTTGFRLTAPDGDVWIFSGGVKGMQQTNPVDGVQTANVSIRPTGEFILNGVEYGA
jgi:hypothetical protein